MMCEKFLNRFQKSLKMQLKNYLKTVKKMEFLILIQLDCEVNVKFQEIEIHFGELMTWIQTKAFIWVRTGKVLESSW